MRTLRDISAAIFDIDGTLLDSSGIWKDLGGRYLRGIGVTPRPGLAGILAPMTMQESCQYLRETYGLPASEADIQSELLGMISRFYREECALKPGAAELLEVLQNRGVTMALATAGDRELSRTALGRLGVLRYFSGIVTCDEYGSKNRPGIFLAAAVLTGSSPTECAIFEDSLQAVRTADSAGFLTAAVRDISEPRQDELRSCADFYAESLSDYAVMLKI